MDEVVASNAQCRIVRHGSDWLQPLPCRPITEIQTPRDEGQRLEALKISTDRKPLQLEGTTMMAVNLF